jgi:predicted metal-dependent phosphoesterase TrpH
LDDVVAAAGGGVISRLHVANVLVGKGCVKTVAEAFERYIGEGRPAYVDKERLTPSEAMAAIRAAGGVAVIAHPIHLGCANSAQLHHVVTTLMHDGAEGIEVYHSDHDDLHTRQYLDLARRLGLLVSGGSDYHGAGKPEVRLGRPAVPLAAAQQLLDRLGAG